MKPGLTILLPTLITLFAVPFGYAETDLCAGYLNQGNYDETIIECSVPLRHGLTYGEK
jgi:hypothetical protein